MRAARAACRGACIAATLGALAHLAPVLPVATPILAQTTPAAPAARPAAGAPAAIDSLVSLGRLQEAAWAARAAGDTARADALVARLDSILRTPPLAARPRSMDSQGVSYTYRLRHEGGVHAIFKVDGSDVFCPECGADREVAAYRIDRLLGLDITPVTVFQSIVVGGDTVRGSSMYFVADASQPGRAGVPKPDRLRFFDAVLGNSDRHDRNWLSTDRVPLIAIDHNRAFEYRPTLSARTCWESEIDSIAAPGRLGRPFERYSTLPPDSLRAAVAEVLDSKEADRFVGMRDRVVRRIRARIERPLRQQPLRDCARDG